MENQYKLVDFKKYCEICKHKDKKHIEDPCCECLDHGANIDSHKPVNFEEKE